MPNFDIQTPALNHTVIRPVIASALEQIKRELQIPVETLIVYTNEYGEAAQPGGTFEERSKSARLQGENIIIAEVTEDFKETTLVANAARSNSTHPIFSDNKLGVKVAPINKVVEVTVNFKFQGSSSIAAGAVRSVMMRNFDKNAAVLQVTAGYHYHLPEKILNLLGYIYSLRETVAGYGDDFATYLSNNITSKSTVVSALDSEGKAIVVKEDMVGIDVIPDFPSIPEKVGRTEGQVVSIAVATFNFTFDVPESIYVTYPMFVHQQPLADIYHNQSRAGVYDSQFAVGDEMTTASKRVDTRPSLVTYSPGVSYLLIPEWDIPTVDQVQKQTATIYIAYCQISETDKRTLLKLDDLGEDYTFNTQIAAWLRKGEYQFLHLLYGSIMQVNLYVDGILQDKSRFHVDADLNVVANQDLNLRSNHHVRFSIFVEDTQVADPALERALEDQETFQILLSVIAEKRLLNINGDKRPPSVNFGNRLGKSWETGHSGWMKTVSTGYVVAKRLS